MNLLDIARNGRFAKAFDPERAIPAETMNELLELLHSSPSSVNAQPWRFVVANTPEAKERIAKDMRADFSTNAPKVTSASHVIVFCTRMTLPEQHLDDILEQEIRDGRFQNAESKDSWGRVVHGWINLHEYDVKDLQHWMEKQTYLALGMLLIAAAELGVDVAPLEGFDPRKLDAELGLREQGFTATVLLCLGYRAAGQDTARPPKSRLSREHLFTFI